MATLMEKDILLEFSTSMVPDTFEYEKKFGKSEEMEEIRKEATDLWKEIMYLDEEEIDYEATMQKIKILQTRAKING
ncbi:MAG: hypothetical protein PUJ85_06445 [bacterium]|nr:hypothetical protein [bacterium]